MTIPPSVAFVKAASSQEAALREIVRSAAGGAFPDMVEPAIALFLANVHLLVHTEVGVAASTQDLSLALEHSPVITSADGTVSLLAGANDVAGYLASVLSTFVRSTSDASLLIPHEYATEGEIGALTERSGIAMRVEDEQVYQNFDASQCEPRLIRKALGSTVAMHSVSWVLASDGRWRKPILAFLPVFDGDGWAVTGLTDALFPKSRSAMH